MSWKPKHVVGPAAKCPSVITHAGKGSVLRVCKHKSRHLHLVIGCGLACVLMSPAATTGPVQSAATTVTERYNYDSAGRLTQVIYDDSYVNQFSYDSNGNITAIQKAKEDLIFSDGFEP